MSIHKTEQQTKEITITFDTIEDVKAVILSGLIARGIIDDDGVCDQDSQTILELGWDLFRNYRCESLRTCFKVSII